MTKRVLIGAAVAAVLFWARHPKIDARLPGASEATVRRAARQELTEERRRQIVELAPLSRAVARAQRADEEQVRKHAAVVQQGGGP